MTNAYKILVEKPGGKRILGRPCCNWEDIKWVFHQYGVTVLTGFIWPRTETSGGLL
jgi:hypothetical protein